MADINSLVSRRGTIKCQLTKFANIVLNFKGIDDVIQLQVRLDKIEDCWTEFQSLQSIIELMSKNPNEEELYRNEFENVYYLTIANFTRIIKNKKI